MPRVVIDPAVPDTLDNEIARLRGLDLKGLRAQHLRSLPLADFRLDFPVRKSVHAA